MIIYIVKVRCEGMGGWGEALPNYDSTLGTFSTREKAEEAIAIRRASKDRSMEVGKPWIEEVRAA